MPIKEFPDVELADENGLLAIGGDLEVESLILAYSNGIFPWPIDEKAPITWFSPRKRLVLFLEDFHPTKKLQKEYKSSKYQFKVNANFRAVINACAKTARKNNDGTWITNAMIEAYCRAHFAGIADSFECYENDELIGGLYGISIGKMFAGESMFHHKSNASKLSLCFLVDYLKEKNVKWIDCQQATPLLKSFGAKEIDRKDFLKLLHEALR